MDLALPTKQDLFNPLLYTRLSEEDVVADSDYYITTSLESVIRTSPKTTFYKKQKISAYHPFIFFKKINKTPKGNIVYVNRATTNV